ncbi:MAG TPA: phenylalanine--tRNA ligase subunit beta, partial [Chloroflexota bacterium]|nr:phenylalanine--tRNA ligase subunit beta [Chloroflexota bacterium]
MRVPLKWLRTYTPASGTPEELGHWLTMGGLEVAAIYRLSETWSNVFVGEVTELRPHPNADRLFLATVQWGESRLLTVVTGAPNLTVGAKVPLALAGARLLDTHSDPPEIRDLRPTRIRGIVSEGMVCSEKELGLGDDHEGILILDREAVPGTPLADELGDVILDVDVTPNRVDAFSMVGIAREVGALLDEPVRIPRSDYSATGPSARSLIEIQIADPDLCPRYMASIVQGVKIGPSPKWLRERLTAAGLRPINNVVDVTNYVMLEWGQPLHAFDYDKIRGKRIVVRRAGDGEKITLLDGSDRALSDQNLVIADGHGAMAVAGVMGGADSEVTPATRNILIESANFNPISVRRTARSMNQLTDAAHRFERGLPRQLTEPAVRRATELVLQVAGGVAAADIADAYPAPTSLPEMFLTPGEVKRLLGLDLSSDRIADLLRRVGCTVAVEEGELRVVPPMIRTDLTIPADLCEEIARILGYEQIPTTLPIGRQPEPTTNPEWAWKNAIRQTMTGLGLEEIITYTLTSRERLGHLLGLSGRSAGPASFLKHVSPASEDGSVDLAGAVTNRFVPLYVDPLEVDNPLSRD